MNSVIKSDKQILELHVNKIQSIARQIERVSTSSSVIQFSEMLELVDSQLNQNVGLGAEKFINQLDSVGSFFRKQDLLISKGFDK